jgi:hypothetical protein
LLDAAQSTNQLSLRPIHIDFGSVADQRQWDVIGSVWQVQLASARPRSASVPRQGQSGFTSFTIDSDLVETRRGLANIGTHLIRGTCHRAFALARFLLAARRGECRERVGTRHLSCVADAPGVSYSDIDHYQHCSKHPSRPVILGRRPALCVSVPFRAPAEPGARPKRAEQPRDPGRREDRQPRSEPNGPRADLDGPKSADCPLHAVARRSGRARSRTRCLTRAPSNGRGSRGGAPPNCAPPTTPATRHARAPGVSEAFRRRGSSPGHMSRCASCGKLKALDLGPGGLPQPWPRPAA